MLTRNILLCLFLVISLMAADKPGKIPLAELISDSQYFKAALGSKALLVTDPKTGEVPKELLHAIASARLNEGIQFYPLPKEAVQPTPKKRNAPEYPAQLRRKGVDGAARLLIVIGADGTIKAIHCNEATHPEFALAAAEAVSKWRFSPATIQETPVPVVATLLLEFDA